MKIGYKLRVQRDKKRLSQQEVANFLQISQRTYSNFESDNSQPSLRQLQQLAEILDFNLLDLLQEQGFVFNQSNNEFKDNSSGIVVNNNHDNCKNCENRFKDKDLIIKQQKEIIALLKEKIVGFEDRLK